MRTEPRMPNHILEIIEDSNGFVVKIIDKDSRRLLVEGRSMNPTPLSLNAFLEATGH